jgi:plasmid stabilization system protein ParE
VTYRVVIAERALARIQEHVEYLVDQAKSPSVAERWLRRVLAAAATLEEFPRRCPEALESAFSEGGIRSLSIDGFLLLFTVDDVAAEVRIVSARHGRQLPDSEPGTAEPGPEASGE